VIPAAWSLPCAKGRSVGRADPRDARRGHVPWARVSDEIVEIRRLAPGVSLLAIG
jgi:hypothetical protein